MNLVVLCDFDGTITKIDTAEFVLARFAQGNWQLFNKQLESGEITLEECLRRQFSLVRASQQQMLSELKNVVTFRPNFEKLAKYCKMHLIPLKVVSAGLDFVIKYFLELNGWQELVELYIPKTDWNTDHIKFSFPTLFDKTSANFKQDLVRRYRRQGKKVIYIGDGFGDYAAAKDANYVFAIKGSKLAKLCEDNRINCENITDFNKVVEAIDRLML